jgi:hypothetical protein
MICVSCSRDLPTAARGLCRACYARWQKRGTTEYAEKRSRSTCSVGGCTKLVAAKGLCDTHRKRMDRHGQLETLRPDDWGAKHKHPLFNAWAYARRCKADRPLVPEWENDFLQFVTDVGPRPSSKHKIFAADETKPLGPSNYVWKTAVTQRVEGEDDTTYRNRQQRVYQQLKKESFKGYDLRKLYGISELQYRDMLEKQNHRCAICKNPETSVIRGQTLSLAVDHCHDTRVVRGLLCSNCNTAIGLLKHDPRLLTSAIDYLRKTDASDFV